MVMMNLYQKLGSPENSSLYKVGHMGANGSKCIAKASLGEIDHTGCPKKHVLAKKSNMVITQLFQIIGSPENFSL